MPKASTVFVIPHTHWDREWYASFQQFRVRLVHLIDDLLELLERDPAYTHFNLDAQTVVLQDYLEIRPERRERLRELIGNRRIGVGPWYVLPDEFLVSGEALVRNLLLGHRLAGDFGHVQKVGYIPDTFGHISQLPQILKGFGIDTAMHFRGLDQGDLKSELWWQSPDGSRVLLHHLPTDLGYVGASALPEDVEGAAKDMQAIARYAATRATSSVLLAMNGMDHAPAREDLPAVLEAATRISAGRYIFRQSSLEEYFEALVAALKDKPLQTVYGELRDTNRTPGRDMRVLPHILSSRIHLKMQNERIQSLLERWAEPWSALLWLLGEDYPQAFLWKAWEWLLQNHPHDSIGGCSVDAVHAQMETRFAWASEIAEEITGERFQLLADRIDLSELKQDEAGLILFNGLPWPLEGAVTVDIDLWDHFLNSVAMQRWQPARSQSDIPPDMEFPDIFRRRIQHAWNEDSPTLPDPAFRGLRVRPLGSVDPLYVQIESMSRATILRPLVSGANIHRDVTRVRASFRANIPAYGYQVYAVAPTARPNRPFSVATPANVLENEFLHVQIAPNGTLTVEDKTTGQVYRDLGYFEDGGDCGDGYNYSNPPEDRVENTRGAAVRISRLSQGPAVQRYRIDHDWSLPEGLDDLRRRRAETRTACPLSVIVSLAEGLRRVDLQVTFDNRARDHRLRMLFSSDVITDVSQSGAQFDVVSRPILIPPVPENAWVEDAPTTLPQQGWVDLSDGKRGLCIISQGLPEYEVLQSSRCDVAVTLLRAVGYLGAGYDLQTADVGAGPRIATPGAQMQRKLTFSLSILPHSGAWEQAEVWRHALALANPPRAFTTAMLKNLPSPAPGTLPPGRSFLSVEGPNVVLSSLKKAEDGEALVLRLYNPSDAAAQAVIQLPFTPTKVQVAGLDERPRVPDAKGSAAELEDAGRVRIAVPPRKIITLRIDRT